MKYTYTLYLFFLWLSLLTACQSEESPTSFQPILTLEEASQITRTQAKLRGSVTLMGSHTMLSSLQFRYGPTPAMANLVNCALDQATPETLLQHLTPNTTYYYCLETGNGYQTVQSELRQFRTLPNQTPTLGTLERISQGPRSVTLFCPLINDGGAPPTEAGFYYQIPGGEKQKKVVSTENTDCLQACIHHLQQNTDYVVQAYAQNNEGESLSQPLSIHTEEAVLLKEAGTLHEILGEDLYQYPLKKLQIVGPINGTDLRTLRLLLGQGIEGAETPGRLEILNLSDATILAGGLSYDGIHYSQDYTVGQQVFAHCAWLTELYLPLNTIRIEQGALDGCPLLRKLYLPTSVCEVLPSTNCPQLKEIQVVRNHPHFQSYEGVLYDREGNTLLWYPEGKTDPQFLPGVQRIGAYAFRHCQFKSLTLPPSVNYLAKNAFYGAHFQQVTLPRAIRQLTKGLFESCLQLTQVTLSPETDYLEDYCFKNCPLQHLYVPVSNFPPHCSEYVFDASHYTDCILHVPARDVSYYRASPVWGRFRQIVGDCPGEVAP